MRRAKQCRIRYAVCRRGNVTRASREYGAAAIGGDSQGLMAKPCTPHLIPQAAQLFELLVCNGGGKGQSPLRSLGGSKGGHSLT